MNLPSLSPVVGLLYVHCSRAERLVGYDEVGHVELGLKVQLDGGVLATVLSLEGGKGKGGLLQDEGEKYCWTHTRLKNSSRS